MASSAAGEPTAGSASTVAAAAGPSGSPTGSSAGPQSKEQIIAALNDRVNKQRGFAGKITEIQSEIREHESPSFLYFSLQLTHFLLSYGTILQGVLDWENIYKYSQK